MAKRTAKFACAILIGLVGSPLLTLLPRVSAVEADDCLTAPTGEKADGQRWRYRSEHGRRCWYLKDAAGDVVPRQSSSGTSTAWDFAQPAPPKLTTRRPDAPAARTDDAAQPATGTRSLVRAQPASASFDDSLQRAMPAAPWQPPQTQLLDSADIDTPAPASTTTADEPAADPDPVTSSQPAPTVDAAAAAQAKPAKAPAPIHKLLLVMIGALTLSGLLASALIRLSKAGSRRRRNRNWQRAVTRVRRNRDKPRSKPKTVQAGGRAAPQPVVATAMPTAPVVRVAPTPPPIIVGPVELPPAIVVVPEKVADPAAELVDLLASRTVKPAPAKPVSVQAPVKAAFREVEPAPMIVETPAPARLPDPEAELVDLLGSHAARKSVQQPPQQAWRPAAEAAPAPVPQRVSEPVPPRMPTIADPEAELANLLESRFAPPPAPPVRHAPERGKPQRPAAPVTAAPVAAAKKPVDPIIELTSMLEAKESQRSARLAEVAPPRRGDPPAVKPSVAPAVDPAAELFDMLEARAARAAAPEAKAAQPIQAPQPVQAAQSTKAARPIKAAEPAPAPRSTQAARPTQAPQPIQAPRATARQPVRAPGRVEAAQPVETARPIDTAEPIRPVQVKAAQPSKPAQVNKAAAPRRKKVPAARTETVAPKPVKAPVEPMDPAPEPIERAAASTDHKESGNGAPRGSRRRNADLRPLPPALMEEPIHDGPTPPLDFIPRPRALRQPVRDVRDDESLDGVQDILARLSRHG